MLPRIKPGSGDKQLADRSMGNPARRRSLVGATVVIVQILETGSRSRDPWPGGRSEALLRDYLGLARRLSIKSTN